MLNVICANNIVENPSVNRHAMKRSMREIPVTISALSIGIFVTPSSNVRAFVRIAWMPRAAAVPIKVAIRAERKAMISVV